MTLALLQDTQDTELDGLRRRCADLERELERLRRSQQARLTIAAEAHRSLLPKPVRHDRIWVDVRYIPVEDIGGDYCQVRFPDRTTCYITVCDVMGHGIDSALLATRISSEVRYGILYRMEPSELVESLQRFMLEYFQQTELFLTFVAARIDLERLEVTWAGAGHPSPLLVRAGHGELQHLCSQNPLLGLDLPALNEVRQDTVALQRGDRLFFFTDGLFEVVNTADYQLRLDGLAKIAQATSRFDLFQVADHVIRTVEEYQHGPSTDDQTLVVAEIR
jgi:sigma-B regulation protein RsbU (phosphoserine phosphatase)